MTKRAPFLAILLAIALLSSSALAQEPSAEDLKTRGNRAMLDLNYAEALAAYAASLEKNPSDLALYYNIGRAHQARGDYPAALDALLEFDQRAPAETKAKVPSLGELIGEVRGRVGELTIRCSADLTNGAVVVSAPTGELAKLEGCATAPKKVRISLPTKTSNVEVRLDSPTFQASSVKIVVEGGAPAPVAVELLVSSRSNAGILRIQAAPASAIIAVDGTPKGNSPVELTVPAGSHVVDVTADDHEKAHVPVVIEAGGRRDLNLTLDKTPPITKRWWFWAGAGAVVATLATVVVILVVQPERDSSKGTIEPGVVSAPLVTF